MRIPIDRGSRVPVYRQIAGRLRQDIESGALPARARLPATRALAEELGVSRITVVTAYAELEDRGLVAAREGSGTYVAAGAAEPGRAGPAAEPSWPRWQRELGPNPPPTPAPVGPRTEPPGGPGSGLPLGGPGPGLPPGGPGSMLPPGGPGPGPPGTLAFTGAGDPRLYPVAALARTIREVLHSDGPAALEYGGDPAGHRPLRETIVEVLASQGLRTSAAQVLVTTGSQQGLALAAQVLLRPGDAVVVEEPTYNLALDLFRAGGQRIVPVPVDRAGMQVDRLEPLLRTHHPRLLYTVPHFQNPSGATLSGPRRTQLLALADRYDVPVVEDDYVGDLRYEGRSPPALKALDTSGQVIYLGTFSKLLMPGVRVGYLVADGPVLDRLAEHKRVQDVMTAPLMQRVLHRYVTVGRYQAHLRRTTRHYRRRRDALMAALRDQLPQVSAPTPAGGLFAWLTLPDGVSARVLHEHARAAGVEVAPGGWFFADPAAGDRHLRLNFVVLTPDEIVEGVRRLATALDRYSVSGSW